MRGVGCCLDSDYYDLVERIGYDYIEFPGAVISRMPEEDFRKVVLKVKEGRIGCYGFVSLLPPEVAVVGPNFNPETVRRFAKAILARGAALGISVVGVGSRYARQLPEGYDMALAWKQAEEFFRIFCEEATVYPGISVMYEALLRWSCQFGHSLKEGADFVRRMNLPNLSLICDIGNIDVEKEDVSDIAYSADVIKHVHIAETVGFERRYLTVEKADYYKAMLGAIWESGYKGNLSIEASAGDIESGCRDTLSILRGILAELGV